MSYEALAIVIAAIAVGSFFKGATGIGLPIIAIPALAAFLGVQLAVVVSTIPTFVSNVWIIWRYRHMASGIPHLPISLVAAAAGTVAGAFVLAALTDDALLWVLIVWIAAYLLNLALNPNFRLEGRMAKYLSPVLAAFAGVSQGATGISGPVVATWIHSYRLQAQLYVFGVSVMFLVIAFVHLVAVSGIGLIWGVVHMPSCTNSRLGTMASSPCHRRSRCISPMPDTATRCTSAITRNMTETPKT